MFKPNVPNMYKFLINENLIYMHNSFPEKSFQARCSPKKSVIIYSKQFNEFILKVKRFDLKRVYFVKILEFL